MSIGRKPWGRIRYDVWVDTFAGQEVFDMLDVEPFDVSFQQQFTLSHASFKCFGVATRSKRLTTTVLLVAWCSGICARTALWMF